MMDALARIRPVVTASEEKERERCKIMEFEMIPNFFTFYIFETHPWLQKIQHPESGDGK